MGFFKVGAKTYHAPTAQQVAQKAEVHRLEDNERRRRKQVEEQLHNLEHIQRTEEKARALDAEVRQRTLSGNLRSARLRELEREQALRAARTNQLLSPNIGGLAPNIGGLSPNIGAGHLRSRSLSNANNAALLQSQLLNQRQADLQARQRRISMETEIAMRNRENQLHVKENMLADRARRVSANAAALKNAQVENEIRQAEERLRRLSTSSRLSHRSPRSSLLGGGLDDFGTGGLHPGLGASLGGHHTISHSPLLSSPRVRRASLSQNHFSNRDANLLAREAALSEAEDRLALQEALSNAGSPHLRAFPSLEPDEGHLGLDGRMMGGHSPSFRSARNSLDYGGYNEQPLFDTGAGSIYGDVHHNSYGGSSLLG